MRKTLALFPFAIALLSAPVPAIAAPIIHQISQTQAQGLTGNGAHITVWSGAGTNIDFTRTGETIYRAWLDDPSRLTIDFDGDLQGGRGGGASLIHLRRVTGISFPNLPSTQTTLLTVVTQSSYGRKVYLFNVSYGSGEPQYASVVVAPEGTNLAGSGLQMADSRTANWGDVQRGLERSVAQGLIESNSPVIRRTQEFLARVRNGMPVARAVTESNVSMALIARLAEMGYATTSLTQQPPVP
jgi:hypothetical protein